MFVNISKFVILARKPGQEVNLNLHIQVLFIIVYILVIYSICTDFVNNFLICNILVYVYTLYL